MSVASVRFVASTGDRPKRQPVKYPRLLRWLILPMKPGAKSSTILHLYEKSRGRFEIVCFCGKSYKRVDGSCRHTEHVLEAMKPWYRQRCKIGKATA